VSILLCVLKGQCCDEEGSDHHQVSSYTTESEVDGVSHVHSEHYSPHHTEIEHQQILSECVGDVTQGIVLQIEEEVVCVVNPESDCFHVSLQYLYLSQINFIALTLFVCLVPVYASLAEVAESTTDSVTI